MRGSDASARMYDKVPQTLRTSFGILDIFEKDVGGVNDCEIFLWIIWTVDFSFWSCSHTETEDRSRQIQSKISRSLTPSTQFQRCQKMSKGFAALCHKKRHQTFAPDHVGVRLGAGGRGVEDSSRGHDIVTVTPPALSLKPQ